MRQVQTAILRIAFEDRNSDQDNAVLLLHGWPDAPRGWNDVSSILEANGCRTIIPYLRGLTPTRFRFSHTPRDGSAVALAQDAVDLANALGLDRFAVVGHDWGARVAYTLAALFPNRVSSITALALGYQPFGVFKVPDFAQSKRFWYQWLMCVEAGADAVRNDPVGFARIQWDTWSPPGWFTAEEFAATAESFSDPDWVSITLNAYRTRWLPDESLDSRYRRLRQALARVERLSRPTLMIQGASDGCDPPSESEGQEELFTGGYRRIVLDDVGHFPHREAPDLVADAILAHFDASGGRT